jgi:hypothetical protein
VAINAAANDVVAKDEFVEVAAPEGESAAE